MSLHGVHVVWACETYSAELISSCGRACYLGCLEQASKSVKVLLNGTQAVVVPTLIILK